MIRLTRCTQPNRAGTYFRLHLSAGDNPLGRLKPSIELKPAWIGTALPLVKLSGFVPPTASNLTRLGRGLHPVEKVRLASTRNRKRAYYDLTVTAPKTISLAALLQPRHTTSRLVTLVHTQAVEKVAQAASRMIAPPSRSRPPMAKWLGVLFHHTHSRERDPHLHTHVILPNVMLNQDGQWRAMQVVINGPNRLKLSLVYGHALAEGLRGIGFGPEIVMSDKGLPEIRSLQPLAKTFSKARSAVLETARQVEAKQPARSADNDQVSRRGSTRALPVSPEEARRLNRRARIADEIRKPKERASDNFARLDEEADRWGFELTNQQFRMVSELLEEHDFSKPGRRSGTGQGRPAPLIGDLVQDASMQMPEGVKFTGPVLMRSAVALSAGRHTWNDLAAEVRAKMARRKKALARMWEIYEADSITIAQAQIAARVNQMHLVRPPSSPTALVPQEAAPAEKPPTPPRASRSSARRR